MPQVWSLGVKEVWRVDHPLDRVVHTLGWPFRLGGKWKELGGSFIYPMGEDMLTIGLVCGLDTLDASLSVHDALQQFKTHPLIRRMLEGGERIGWGAKTIPEGGFLSIPHRLSVPGAIVTGDSAGFVNVPKLKGIHYAMRSGMLAAETIYEALKGGAELNTAALTGYDDRVRRSHIWSDLRRVRNMRQALGKGMFVGAPIGGIMDITRGALPGGSWKFHRDAEEPVESGSREYPVPDGKLTFDKLSSVFLSGNRSRDDQPNHIRVAESVPREVAQAWVAMCPAAVYEIDGDDGGPAVRLKLSPSNCVQCGAITARGGRLTPPEGGSGPEYTLT
jgi:electron-transferring-flavoprotein dehydrogenase